MLSRDKEWVVEKEDGNDINDGIQRITEKNLYILTDTLTSHHTHTHTERKRQTYACKMSFHIMQIKLMTR